MAESPRISFLAFFLMWADLKGWVVPRLHVTICLWLERLWLNGRAGVLEVMRGAGKSTIVAVFQAWVLYIDASARILDQACDNPTARKLSRDTRGVLRRHPLCKGMLPRDDAAVESINVVGNPDERNPNIAAHGVLSNTTSSRADMVVFDDVEVPKNCRSDDARSMLRERMGEATHILVPGGKKLFIGTPHTHDSIYDEQTAAGVLTLKIPLFEHHVRYEEGATAKQRRFPFNFAGPLYVWLGRTKDSRLLVEGVDYRVERSAVVFDKAPDRLVDIYAGNAWPDRFDRDDLALRRRDCKTLNTWDSQYQLHAKPLHEVRLDPARIIAYAVEPTILEANGEVRMLLGETRIVGVVARWDCALGKVKGDDSALSVVFTNERGELFWHIAKGLTGDVDQQCQQVREIMVRYQIGRVTVETNGVGGFVPPILRKHLAGLNCHVDEQASTANKDARILEGLEPPLSGRFLWAHVDALDAFESQMRAWVPGVPGQRDDFLDSGSGAILQTPARIGKPVGKVVEVERREWRPDAGSYKIEIGEQRHAG